MTEPIRLRPATPADEPFLLRVYAATRAEELALTGWDEAAKAAFLRMQFHAQARSYLDRFPDSWYQVILAGDEPIGRLFVGRSPAEIRLVDLALLPEHRGRGIGGALVRGLMAEASRAGTPLRLQVERASPALRLYRRLGFVVIGESGLAYELECPGTDPPAPAGDP